MADRPTKYRHIDDDSVMGFIRMHLMDWNHCPSLLTISLEFGYKCESGSVRRSVERLKARGLIYSIKGRGIFLGQKPRTLVNARRPVPAPKQAEGP